MSNFRLITLGKWNQLLRGPIFLLIAMSLAHPAFAKRTPAYEVHETLARQNSFVQSKINYDGKGPEYLQIKRVPVDDQRDTQLPAAFVDGVALSLEAYANYDAVAALLKLEGLKPKREFIKVGKDPKTGEDILSNDFTKITLSFCRDNRITYGSADTVRIAFQAQLDEKDFENPKDYELLNKKNSNYVEMRVIWRYWADSPFEKVPLIRKVMGYPAVSANVDLEVSGPKKSIVLQDKKTGAVILKANFSSRIDQRYSHFTNLPTMVILPGNETFSPEAKNLSRKNLITWLDGFATPEMDKQDFNSDTDHFETHGKLNTLLNSIGFTTKYAKWTLVHSYTGVFENRSVKLRMHN